MASLPDHDYCLPWLGWKDITIKTEELDLGFEDGMITGLNTDALGPENHEVTPTIKEEPFSEDESGSQLPNSTKEEKKNACQQQKSGLNPQDPLLLIEDNSLQGSSKRKLSLEKNEMQEEEDLQISKKRMKTVSKHFCSLCQESLYSKNWARHKKAKKHIYLEVMRKRADPTDSLYQAKIINISASTLASFVPVDQLEPFKEAFLKQGYLIQDLRCGLDVG